MQGCHSPVARRLVGVGSQMASIRSASIGSFRSFTTSGEGLKLPVSEFHPILRQYSRCPFSRLSCHSQRSRSRTSNTLYLISCPLPPFTNPCGSRGAGAWYRSDSGPSEESHNFLMLG